MPESYTYEEPEEDRTDSLKTLNSLTLKMLQLMERAAELDDLLRGVKKELIKYKDDLIPELMTGLGLESVTTAGGLNVKLKSEVRASFPKDSVKAAQAMKYLEETGNDNIVKRQFIIQYGRDSMTWAREFSKKLKELDVDSHASVEERSNIHHQTLLKFIRTQLKEGKGIPLEAFGAFVQRTVIIKAP